MSLQNTYFVSIQINKHMTNTLFAWLVNISSVKYEWTLSSTYLAHDIINEIYSVMLDLTRYDTWRKYKKVLL